MTICFFFTPTHKPILHPIYARVCQNRVRKTLGEIKLNYWNDVLGLRKKTFGRERERFSSML
jgi:hypothetical protein